jgi:glycosyltransferase involved in cell wall biosynthesis
MVSQPLVSICIPTYNRAGMVEKAITSALAQSYSRLEVIVVDNASTDNTHEIVEKITDDRLRYYRNPVNLGLFGNFNRCIELSQGDYIHILHSDDYIDPEFTSRCMLFFKDNPNVDLTFTSVKIITDIHETDSSNSDKNKFPRLYKDEVFTAPEGFRRILTERPFIFCPTVMMKRSLYEKYGKYSLEFPYSSDFDLWLKVTREHDIGFVSDAELFYYQGEHSESYQHLFKNVTGYLDTLKIYTNLIRSLGDERSCFDNEVNISLKRFARDCLFAGFTRLDTMNDYNPSFLTGTALSAWSMIRPSSLCDMLKKTGLLFVILTAGCIMGIPPLGSFVKRIFLRKTETY